MHNSQKLTGYGAYRRKRNIKRRETYRDICFRYWDECCAVCGWDKSIDVHHVNDDHCDDRPENLIPLCQNHHMLTRMKDHAHVIREQLSVIITEKFGIVVKWEDATSAE